MATLDVRLRINGRVADDVAQAVARLAVALRDAGDAAGLESVLDLGGLVIEAVRPPPPVVEPKLEKPKAAPSKK